MSPNRIVAVLTPLVFAPLAGACAAWLAEHFPGVEVDESSLEQIFIAGALIALAPAAQWLHGWQKHEARQAELERDGALAALPAAIAPDLLAPPDEEELALPDELEELDDLEDLDASDDLDELDELDQLDELDALGAVDAFDEDELLDEDDPLVAGS